MTEKAAINARMVYIMCDFVLMRVLLLFIGGYFFLKKSVKGSKEKY